MVVEKFCFSYALTRVKKDKMVSCGAPGCTNRADKNSNIMIFVIIKMFL